MAQSWTKQKVLDEIQALYNRKGRINSAFVQHQTPNLYQAALRCFGNYRNTVEAAGFSYEKIKRSEGNVVVVTSEKVVKQICHIYMTRGKINSRFVQDRWPSLWGIARKRFGSYGAAVKAAGFDYKKIKAEEHQKRVIWNSEKVKTELSKFYRKHKKLSLKFVIQRKPSLAAAAVKQFGSFRKAVEAIGVDYESVHLHFSVLKYKNKEEVRREIRRRHRLGLPINSKTVYKEANSLFYGAQIHFPRPSWTNALCFAGIDPIDVSPKTYWQRESFLLEEIRKRFDSGLPLYTSYVDRKCVGMYRGAIKVFGSWPKAIKAAGLNWKEVKKPFPRFWTRKTVIAEIKRLEKAGVRLSAKAIQRHHRPLFSSATAVFGSWAEAVAAADINYLDHSVLWLSRVWLRKLTEPDVVKLKQRADELIDLHFKQKRRRKR